MKKINLLIITTLLLSFNFSTLVMADDIEADDAIKYRKAVMSAIKGHNAAIKQIASGKVPFKAQLHHHVIALEKLFNELPHLFPEGSDFGKTNAKDAIWDKPEKFAATIKKSQKAMAALKAVAATGDLAKTAKAMKKFGKASCGGCHKSFKKKPKK